MVLEEAKKIIEEEELNRYRKITFDGNNIVENQSGIRKTEDGWQVFSTNEKGGIEIIETYKIKEDAISHMIEGLRIEKRLTERMLRRMKRKG